MPRFIGDTHRNSKVYVDYVKDTVVFEPVGKAKLFWNWIIFILALFATGALPLYSFLLTGIVYIGIISGGVGNSIVFGEALDYYFYKGAYAMLIIWVMPLLMSLPYLYKPWRKNYFPAFMAMLDILEHKTKKAVCNPEAIIDNKYIIPFFANVMLKYELWGDFSRQIESVKIENLFMDDAYKWMVVFRFKNKPLDGKLSVHYI
jgi:hypothetical protein